MKIYVDGDACPVKSLIVQGALKYNVEVIIVVNICHNLKEDGYSQHIIVDHSAQSVDMMIISKTCKNDVVITDDYGLASILLMKKVFCLSTKGFVYTLDNIDHLMYRRYINTKILKGGGKIKGPSKRTKNDDIKFIKILDQIIKKSLYHPYP